MKNYSSPCIILMSLLYACHAYPDGGVSPSILQQMFSEIFSATGVYPDDRNPDSYLLIVNELTDHCMNVKGGYAGPGQHVISYPCAFNNDVLSQSFYIHFAGDGYVGLSTELDKCIGVGYDRGSPVYTGNWCDSPSHQFAMIVEGGYVYFQQRETGNCLASSTSSDVDNAFLTADTCTSKNDNYPELQWRFCETNGTLCWPSPRS